MELSSERGTKEDSGSGDDCSSQSVTSTTMSSQEDLEWDNYSPPLCSCTDECSCTPSASYCILCGGLTVSRSGQGRPCRGLNRDSPDSRDTSRTSSFITWPNTICRRDETDSQSTGKDLRSLDSPSCSSRASRLVSSTQDDVLDASIVLSGKPSSASIDFRRKCTAYWDSVRNLHSISASTGCLTEATTEADTCCVSAACSLLSLTDSEGSCSSRPPRSTRLRVFQSISAPNDGPRFDRISLTRRATARTRSADEICRLCITSIDDDRRSLDDDRRSPDDEPRRRHERKRGSSVVRTYCCDGQFSYHSALPVQECEPIIYCGHKDEGNQKNQNDSKRGRDRSHRSKHVRDHRDQIASYRDRSDPFKDHENARQHPWSTGHQFRPDTKLVDHRCESKDENRHIHHGRKREDHFHDSRDDSDPETRKKDHSKDRRVHMHHIKLRVDSKRQHGNRQPCRIKTDRHRQNARGSSRRRHHKADNDNDDCARFRNSDPRSSNHQRGRCRCTDGAGNKSNRRTSDKLRGCKQRCRRSKHHHKHHGHHEHNECGFIKLTDQQDQNQSDGDHEYRETNATNEIHDDTRFATYKDVESYCRCFNSDIESDLEDYVADLKHRQSRYLKDDIFDMQGFKICENAQEAEKEMEQHKNKTRESEERVEKLETMLEVDNACNIICNIPSLSKGTTCERTETAENVAEQRPIIDLLCCDYPVSIPPLEYFLVRARVSIEGDLDERAEIAASPFIYEPMPAAVRNCTVPEAANGYVCIEPLHKVQSTQSYEPQLALLPFTRRTLIRVAAQDTPSILAARHSVYTPEKKPETPALAYKSTVDGDRRLTSIRDKAENMPIVRRVIQTQTGDVTDVRQIEALSNRRSWGLKSELVSSDLATAASITKSSFVESERRPSGKSVGWIRQVTPSFRQERSAASAAAAAADNESFDSMASYSTQDSSSTPSCLPPDKGSPTESKSSTQKANTFAENRKSSQSLTASFTVSSAPTSSLLRSILVASRMSEENEISSTIGGSRASAIPEGRRRSSMSGGSRLSSLIPGGSRLSSGVPYDGRLVSSDESNYQACPDGSEPPCFGPVETRHASLPAADTERRRRATFGFSERKVTVRLSRQETINVYGLTIAYFESVPEILVSAAPHLAQADVCQLIPSFITAEVIPAIEDLIVQIPSQTQPPPYPPRSRGDSSDGARLKEQSQIQSPPPQTRDDLLDVKCLRELLAVPLSGQDDSEDELSADSDGQLCKASSSRFSNPCLDSSAGGVPFRQSKFCPPPSAASSSSKQPLPNLYPSDNCLCTSVTQVVSRSMKHDGNSDTCAALRDKCSSSSRNKWHRSLSSKTFPDIGSEGSIPDGNSSTTDSNAGACQSNLTSTWVDCHIPLSGSELRHPSLDSDEYDAELPETSSCTDSVTTIYTRLPTSSSDRHRTIRTINCCALATESCDEYCLNRPKRRCQEFERKPLGLCRNCWRSSPEAAAASCAHRCHPVDDRIVASTVVASLQHHRCNTGDWTYGTRSREQNFERKYKALRRFCIETFGCVPPPPTPLCFE